jgi:hypothetical protein
MKSGSLNILEPSGPVKACNGIALLYIQKLDLPTGECECGEIGDLVNKWLCYVMKHRNINTYLKIAEDPTIRISKY